jgi:hypothetical protein
VLKFALPTNKENQVAFTPFTTTNHGRVTYRCKHPLINIRTSGVIQVKCDGKNVMYAIDELSDVAWTPLCAISDVVKFEEIAK